MIGGSAKQASDKIGQLKQFVKETTIARFQQSSLDELNQVSIKAKQIINESISKLKSKQPIFNFTSMASPLDLVVPERLKAQTITEEEKLLAIAKDVNKVDRSEFKAKIMLAFFADKPSQNFTRKF